MDIPIETVEGGAVALECDFRASNPLPVVQWFADGAILVEENLLNNAVLYLNGGRYLYIRALTAAQRMMRYHCEVVNFRDENDMRLRAPTTYTLSTELQNTGITVYKGLGTQIGRVGESLQFVFAAGSRNVAGDFSLFAIFCSSNAFVSSSVQNNYVITVTLLAAAANETEVAFTCQLLGAGMIMPIMSTIIVSRE